MDTNHLTLQERMTGFQTQLEQLQQRYGMQLNIQTQPEQLGQATLVKSVIQMLPIPNWQPMTDDSQGAIEPKHD